MCQTDESDLKGASVFAGTLVHEIKQRFVFTGNGKSHPVTTKKQNCPLLNVLISTEDC